MYPYFDLNSLILYTIIGILGAYCIKMGINNRNEVSFPWQIGYVCLILMYVLLAGLRLVTPNGIGGKDTYGYEIDFLNAFLSTSRFDEQDILFGIFNKLIRSITDNVIVYRFICYFIITYAYVYFINTFCKKRISCIPFIVLMIPYLKSFNTMRSSLAIAIILIGLVMLKQKKTLWSIVLICASVFIHRMSILFVMFFPFYGLLKKYKFNNSKLWLIVIVSALTIIAYFTAFYIQEYILQMGILIGNDTAYIKMNRENSILETSVTLFPLLLISIMWLICMRKLKSNDDISFLKLMVIFDIISTPVAFILGMWRANEYFYVGRLAFWSYLIPAFSSKFNITIRKVINVVFFILFTAWLVYRICREWEPCGLMPYKLI